MSRDAGSQPTSATVTSGESNPSSSADPAVAPPSGSKKVQFTGKVRRGLALLRMVQMAAMSEDCPPVPTFVSRWSKAQMSDYNAALAWVEQEEDWDAVEGAWERGRTGK